jgi:hypothetical protein
VEDKSLAQEEEEYLRDARRLMASPAYSDPGHRDHLQIKRDVKRLMTAAHGNPEEVAAELRRPLNGPEKIWGVR